MTNQFIISPINPIRFYGGTGTKFERLPFDELFNIYQDPRCYDQKWNIGDVTRLQILSDFEFTFEIRELESNALVQNINPIDTGVSLFMQTFTVYEVPISFVGYDEGRYYCLIRYQNELEQTVERHSEPILVLEDHPNTMFFTYKNSENNFNVVFDTDIEFNYRVEGLVAEFTPQSDSVIYNDQKRNATNLYTLPWRSFMLFVGDSPGIPQYVADTVNFIMSCDQIHLDSPTFDGDISRVEGAEWEIERQDQYALIGLRMEIMPVENRLALQLISGETPNEITIVQKIRNYEDQTDSIAISGEFADKRLLEKICIEKQPDTVPITFNVGISPDGDEIGSFLLENEEAGQPQAFTLTINHLFLGDETVYLSWGSQELPFISVIYKNLLENPIPLGMGQNGGGAQGILPVGACLTYFEIAGRLVDQDFDLVTGLGRQTGNWYGWAVADGRNGTFPLGGRVEIGWDGEDYNLGDEGGSETHTLTVDEMPEHSHEYFDNSSDPQYKRGNTGSEVFGFPNNTSQTESAGNGEAHNNMQPYRVVLKVVKIFDPSAT